MSIAFIADEIFEMAERLESNGAKYYYRAAALNFDQDIRNKLIELGKMEENHEKVFAAMRAELPAAHRIDTVPDPDNQAVLYLRAMADGYVFDLKKDPSEVLTENTSLKQILKTAIGLEKDSIIFYLEMKNIVPANLGKGKIDTIIKEEMEHIRTLNSQLVSLDQHGKN